MANSITGIRFVCSMLLLFCPVLSTAFYIIYFIAGVSDMLDGWVARHTNSVSELGAKLDTMADFIFVIVCLIKLIPVMEIPLWIYVWIAVIAGIKFFNLGYGCWKNKQLVAVHNTLNKVTGFLLFLYPLTWTFIDYQHSAIAICVVATWAAIKENLCIQHQLL